VLVGFARQVREDGAAPVVVVFGRRPDIIRLHDGRAKAYGPLLDWLAREDIPTIDVTERLAEETGPTNLNAFFTRGAHYNADGNRLVAAVLADRLPRLVDATCRSG